MDSFRTKISRRGFIRGMSTAIGMGALGVPLLERRSALFASVPRLVEASRNPLRRPPAFTGEELVASMHQQSVWTDRPTTVWTYGESYPAPTIRVRRGERFRAELRNMLDEPTNIHWHGLLVPADMDGHAMDVVPAGETKQFDFTIDQRAGLYWYHPHPDMRTGKQVFMGMAGFFIVEDDEERALNLPSGEFEIPLVIQDRRLREDRQFAYNLVMRDMMEGFLGDTILANGTPDAEVDLANSLYRLRVLNGSNARVYKLAMTDGTPMHVIGTDCGLLDRPYEAESFFLGPAERVDLIIDLSGHAVGTSVKLVAENFDGAIDWTMQGWGGDILQMNIVRQGPMRLLPITLSSVDRLVPEQAVRTRSFELDMPMPMPMRGMHTINGRVFDGMRIDETVVAGDVEMWELVNVSDEPHPIHIHGAMFQIHDRDGNPIDDPKDMGWKDTALVWGGQRVRILVRFGPHAGTFLMHCHNLEHEDDGMMMNYEIEEAVSDVGDRARANRALDLR